MNSGHRASGKARVPGHGPATPVQVPTPARADSGPFQGARLLVAVVPFNRAPESKSKAKPQSQKVVFREVLYTGLPSGANIRKPILGSFA